MRHLMNVALCVSAIALVGCPSSESASCIENETQACLCADGAFGVQTCNADGAFSTCDCPSAPPDCAVNETRPCLCAGGFVGVQTCDGTGVFSACDCGTLCGSGYEYSSSGCVDIDECATGLAACAPNATCVNLVGSYGCACNEGFSGNGMTCLDDDECALGLDDCDVNASCINSSGGFTCACNGGYLGDGVTCTPIADTLVADVSANPVHVIVDGVGTFDIDGLSYLGWSFDIIETPLTGGRTHKELGLVEYPDVTMRGLRGSAAAVANLVAWCNSGLGGGVPRVITVTLVGLGNESITLNLLGTLPLSADTTVTTDAVGDRMAELVFGLGYGVAPDMPLIDMISYSPPYAGAYPQYPAPGQLVEISGVTTIHPAWPVGELAVPVVGTSDPLFLPNLPRSAEQVFDFMYAKTSGSLMVPVCSVVDYDLNGPINGPLYRVNLFNCLPERLDLFNPQKPYGTTYLLDLHLVLDSVEEA